MGFDTVHTNHTLENLLVSDIDVVADSGTILTGAGANYARGTVLGKITASGKLTICDKDAVNGAAVPFAVLANDTDATAADKSATVYLAGGFNVSSLVFASGTVAADVKDLARDKGMYFITVQAAV